MCLRIMAGWNPDQTSSPSMAEAMTTGISRRSKVDHDGDTIACLDTLGKVGGLGKFNGHEKSLGTAAAPD